MPKKFTEWLRDADEREKGGIKKVIIAVLPANVDSMKDAEIKEKLGDAILQAVIDAGHDVGPDNLDDLLDLIDDNWTEPFDPEKDWATFC